MNKKIFLIVVGAVFALVHAVFCFWLASYFFLKLSKMESWPETSQATFSTYTDYKTAYGDQAHVKKALNNAAVLAFMVFAIPVGGAAFLALKRPGRALYGSSRLATPQEALKALSAENGIICGQVGNKYLCFGGTEHALMEAPTRSGKGVGVVIPNLLTFPESVVVLDVKHENFNLTSGFRAKHGQDVYFFNPACAPADTPEGEAIDYSKLKSHRWNPFGYVSKDFNFRVDDLQKIGAMIFVADKDPFWANSARSIFLGITLYLMDTPELPFTLGEVYRQASNLAKKEYFLELAQRREKEGNPLHPQAVISFKGFAGNSDNTAGSIMQTVNSTLALWANPVIDAATAANDFDLRNLRKKKMSIYIGVTPDNIDRLAFLVSLFFQQCFDLNTRQLPQDNPLLKYKCLFLMDESPVLGKMPILEKGIGYFAGYNLRLLIIVQSGSQLITLYGEAAKDTFMSNLALRIIFTPRENKVAAEISESLGYITETNISKSRSQSGGKGGQSSSKSESAVKRAVFWPHELREMPLTESILIIAGIPPIKCKKIKYYADPVFKVRLLSPSPVPSLMIDTTANIVSALPEQKVAVVALTTPEQVDTLNLGNIKFVHSKVKLPKPAVLDDDPDALAEDYLFALGLEGL